MNDIDHKNESIKSFVIGSIVIFFIWLVSYPIISKVFLKEDRGQFGDTFGAVNALFSGLAMAGVIYTIHLQRKELSLQRQELIQTREELKRTADAQEKSEKALIRQANNLKISAKLSALNTMVIFYNDQLINNRNGITIHQKREMESKRQNYLEQIENIIHNKK